MALSKSQKGILSKYSIPLELQDWIAQEFDEQGNPKSNDAPDFLLVISDHLQAAEMYLAFQRIKLNRLQNPIEEKPVSPEEWEVLNKATEEVVKEAWLRATAYWRMIDEIILSPKEYGIKINRRHVEYAFHKKNLPLVEMLRFAKPEFFEIPDPSFIKKWGTGILGFIFGFFSGFWGGLMGRRTALHNRSFILKLPQLLKHFLSALFTGTISGATLASSFGYRTGELATATELGLIASSFNPFNEPIGSKEQQAVELKIQQAYFLLSQQKNSITKQAKRLQERFSLRFAEETDVKLILKFINELASYEKLQHEVVATESALKQSLFGDRQVAEVIIASFDKEPIGFALFFHNFSTFLGKPGLYIEDLYIRQDMRGYGFGKRMLSFLAKIAIERGCGRMEWWVLDWNKPAIQFYEKLGAIPMKDWTVYRVVGNVLEDLSKEY